MAQRTQLVSLYACHPALDAPGLPVFLSVVTGDTAVVDVGDLGCLDCPVQLGL